MRLLGEEHAKSFEATYRLVNQTAEDDDERIARLRSLWEMAKVSLLDEAVTYDVATQLGCVLDENKGQYEEAKVFFLAALEGRRRVFGAEHKFTLDLTNNVGIVHGEMEEY